MQTFFAEYVERLQNCHNDILRAVDGLTSSALDWTPGPDMNSVSVLVFHLSRGRTILDRRCGCAGTVGTGSGMRSSKSKAWRRMP